MRQAVSFRRGLHEQVESETTSWVFLGSLLPWLWSALLPRAAQSILGPRGPPRLHPKSETPPQGGGGPLPLIGPQLGWVCSFLEGRGLSVYGRGSLLEQGSCTLGTLGSHQPASSLQPLMFRFSLRAVASQFCMQRAAAP